MLAVVLFILVIMDNIPQTSQPIKIIFVFKALIISSFVSLFWILFTNGIYSLIEKYRTLKELKKKHLNNKKKMKEDVYYLLIY